MIKWDKVIFCISEVIVFLVFSGAGGGREAWRVSKYKVGRACVEGIGQTVLKQTPTNHEFWKFLAASAFPLTLQNISKAGSQKKTSHVHFKIKLGLCGEARGQAQRQHTLFGRAHYKALTFIPLCAGKDHSRENDSPPLHLDNKED